MDKKRDYLSGAQKRKIHQQKLDAVKKLPKLDTFFKKITNTTENVSSENVIVIEPGPAPDNQPGRSLTCYSADIPDEFKKETTNGIPDDDCNENENEETFLESASSLQPCETDICKFPEGSFKPQTKQLILASKPCQPRGPFPKDLISKRSFSADYYSFKNKTGQIVDRFWLLFPYFKWCIL